MGFKGHCSAWLIIELAIFGLGRYSAFSSAEGQHSKVWRGGRWRCHRWEWEQSTGHRQGPKDSSSLGLICLFGGAFALCIHFAGVMEGSPRGANPRRDPGRQAAGFWSGSDRVDQAWDLDQPEEGRSPEGSMVPHIRSSGPPRSLVLG